MLAMLLNVDTITVEIELYHIIVSYGVLEDVFFGVQFPSPL